MIGSGWRDQTDCWAEQGETDGDQPPGEGGESAAGDITDLWLADTNTGLWLADTNCDLWLVTAADNREEEEEGDSQRHQDWHPVQLRQEARRAGESDKIVENKENDESQYYLAHIYAKLILNSGLDEFRLS